MLTIKKYFPDLTLLQQQQFEQFDDLYRSWNEKINVISRKDIDNLYLHHVLHSLAITRLLGDLKPGTTILDMGTGGGFPGIPLAVYYPEAKFHLIDRIGKKINVCREVALALGLKNVTFQHGDIGECHGKYDYVVSRAVMRLDTLVKLVRKNVSPKSVNPVHNGLVCLKGNEIEDESRDIKGTVITYPISEIFTEDFFQTKSIIYVPL